MGEQESVVKNEREFSAAPNSSAFCLALRTAIPERYVGANTFAFRCSENLSKLPLLDKLKYIERLQQLSRKT